MGDRRKRAPRVWFDGKLRPDSLGPKVVRHARYVTFQLADVAVPLDLLAAILERIQRFGVPPPLVQRG